MPDDATPPTGPQRRAGAAFAGETTRSMAGTPGSTGETILPAAAPPLAEKIGDFEVLGKLGEGGMVRSIAHGRSRSTGKSR